MGWNFVALQQAMSPRGRLNLHQRLGVDVLQMSALELSSFMDTLAVENPLLEWQDTPEKSDSCVLWGKGYSPFAPLDESVFARTASADTMGESLACFLRVQIRQLGLPPARAGLAEILADCLDEDGYLRIPDEELAQALCTPLDEIRLARAVIQSLDPPGVGAENLARCLWLQLARTGCSGPAADIALHHLEALALGHDRAIAGRLNISLAEVQAAREKIVRLSPRPGAPFAPSPETIPCLLPDLLVEATDGGFQVRCLHSCVRFFRLDPYYLSLLKESSEPEIHRYLLEKAAQVRTVLSALHQRESTLSRCAQVIVRRQRPFFQDGPSRLQPLTMQEVAEELRLHPSTISRAVREKFIQCAWGVYPLSYFFPQRLSAQQSVRFGPSAAHAMLRQLIQEEDPHSPLSDQQLSLRLTQAGYPLSRRTVAKYRAELGIPGTFSRRKAGESSRGEESDHVYL